MRGLQCAMCEGCNQADALAHQCSSSLHQGNQGVSKATTYAATASCAVSQGLPGRDEVLSANSWSGRPISIGQAGP